MNIRVKGVKQTTIKGHRYYYHRGTGRRITAAPGTMAFAAEVERLNQLFKRKGVGTWGALVTAYKSSPEFARLADRTKEDYVKVLEYLRPLDATLVTDIDAPAVIKIRDKAFEYQKRRFANHTLQVVATVMNWGKPRKLSDGYPLAGNRSVKLKRPVDAPRINRPWTDEERDVVLRAAEGGLKRALALGMFAGMRVGDVVSVRWSIYDGASLEWEQGKTGDRVWIPAASELRSILDAAPRDAVTIVTGVAGRPISRAWLEKWLHELLAKLEARGLVEPGLTFHGLRHTNGKILADLGADPRAIQALLGHRSMAASLHYSNDASRRRGAIAAVELLEQHRAKRAKHD